MKRRYQTDQQRAVQEFRQLAPEQNPNLQMIFPLTEVVVLLHEGVGHLMREAGLALMNLVMEEEVRHLAGERHEQHPHGRPTTSIRGKIIWRLGVVRGPVAETLAPPVAGRSGIVSS